MGLLFNKAYYLFYYFQILHQLGNLSESMDQGYYISIPYLGFQMPNIK